MTTSVDIRGALETYLDTLSPTWPTAYENMAFTRPSDLKYQRVFMLNAEPFAYAGKDAATKYNGVFQVNVVTPADGGAGVAEARADALLTHFKRGTSFSNGTATVRTLQPYLARSYQAEDEFIVPVWVPWFCHIF